jgi:TRAP-type C4-dicarboxylate transport system substrate-binding protein
MLTEYTQSAMPGLGITTFAKDLSELSAGKLQVKPSFDATARIRSAGMLAAIEEGRVQTGDVFAGALEPKDPIFALPSLPSASRTRIFVPLMVEHFYSQRAWAQFRSRGIASPMAIFFA